MNIFQKTALIAALLVGQAAVAAAQQAVDIKWNRVNHQQRKLTLTNKLHAPIILELTFRAPSTFEASVSMPYTTSLSAGGTTSITLTDKIGTADYAFTYRTWWGCRNAKIDADYPYLLPVGKNGETKISGLSLFGRKRKVPVQNHYALSFYTSKGDTVYAARRGTVFSFKDDADLKHDNYAMTTQDNRLYIMHKDCSYARYGVLNEILVKEGQTVEAGEPIAIVGGDKYARGNHVRFSVISAYFCDSCENRKGTYGSAYLKPKFYQKEGVVDTLTYNNSYTATHPDEIVTREMSKRELKKWRKEHALPSR